MRGFSFISFGIIYLGFACILAANNVKDSDYTEFNICDSWAMKVAEGDLRFLSLGCSRCIDHSAFFELCSHNSNARDFNVDLNSKMDTIYGIFGFEVEEDFSSTPGARDIDSDGMITVDELSPIQRDYFVSTHGLMSEDIVQGLFSVRSELINDMKLDLSATDIAFVVASVFGVIIDFSFDYNYPSIVKVISGLFVLSTLFVHGYFYVACSFALHYIIRGDPRVRCGTAIPALILTLFFSAIIENNILASAFIVACLASFVFYLAKKFSLAGGARGELSLMTGGILGLSLTFTLMSMVAGRMQGRFTSNLLIFIGSSVVPASETGSFSFFRNAFVTSLVIIRQFCIQFAIRPTPMVKLLGTFSLVCFRFSLFLGIRTCVYARILGSRGGKGLWVCCKAYLGDVSRPFSILWFCRFNHLDTWIRFFIWLIVTIMEMRFALEVFILRLFFFVYMTVFDDFGCKVAYNALAAGVHIVDFDCAGFIPDIPINTIVALTSSAGKLTVNNIVGSCTAVYGKTGFKFYTAGHVSNKMRVGDDVSVEVAGGVVEGVVGHIENVTNFSNLNDSVSRFSVNVKSGMDVVSSLKEVYSKAPITKLVPSEWGKVVSMVLIRPDNGLQVIPSWTFNDDQVEVVSSVRNGDSGSMCIGVLRNGDVRAIGVATHGVMNGPNIITLFIPKSSGFDGGARMLYSDNIPDNSESSGEEDGSRGIALVNSASILEGILKGIKEGRIHLDDPPRLELEGRYSEAQSLDVDAKRKAMRKLRDDITDALCSRIGNNDFHSTIRMVLNGNRPLVFRPV